MESLSADWVQECFWKVSLAVGRFFWWKTMDASWLHR
jgi:hypothetical protein